jgi:hypothetical protein
MRNKFEEIMKSLREFFKLNTSCKERGEVEEDHECDCMTVCPKKPSNEAQEELEENMLLRELGQGGNK